MQSCFQIYMCVYEVITIFQVYLVECKYKCLPVNTPSYCCKCMELTASTIATKIVHHFMFLAAGSIVTFTMKAANEGAELKYEV